jgi:hypothetical protein
MTSVRKILFVLAALLVWSNPGSYAQSDSSSAAADATGPTPGADPVGGSAAAMDPADDQSTKAAGTITVTSDPLAMARALINPKGFDLVTSGASSPK